VHNVDREDASGYSTEPLPLASACPGRIMNSGGSTGKPKLIADPNPSTWGADKAGRRCTPRMTLLLPAPFYHSAPFAYATMALAQGGHLLCMERFDPAEWLDIVTCFRPSFAYLVPTMMSRIAKLPPELTAAADLSSIDTLLHMAGPCPPSIKRWWIERIGPEKVLEVYGGTERIGATVIDGTQWLAHPGSVGRAAAGFEILILGEEGEVMSPGEVGDIYFRAQLGPGTNYSYIGALPRLKGNLDSFGDMGWVDEQGWLYLADRRTDMILIGGVNVYPAEVEDALEMLPGVLCAAVIGLPDADMGNQLHAIIELAPGQEEPQDRELFTAPALAALARIKHPRSWEFTRNRIRDDTGKVRRFLLRAERMPKGRKE
jgi:bile acid-coenzyme A ligase